MSNMNSDIELYKALKRLLDVYREEAKKGRYLLFARESVLDENIDVSIQETAANIGEGLKNIARIVYFVATGKDEETNPSLAIDGYMWFDSALWPVLDLMLSRSGTPQIEIVESRVSELEKAIMSSPKKTNIVHKADPLSGREPEAFLDEIFKLIEEDVDVEKSKWTWLYNPKKDMIAMLVGLTVYKKIKENGYIDTNEQPVNVEDYKEKRRGISNLREFLKGKKILSVGDDSDSSWYLKILKQKEI